MAKIITAAELAEIVTKLLKDPSAIGEDMTTEVYSRFMTQVAQAVCDNCGGEIQNPAAPNDGNDIGHFMIGIHGDDSLPKDGGIWKNYDPEGELFDDEPSNAETPNC